MTKKIKLSGVYGEGKFALVDDDVYGLLSERSWHVNNRGYALRSANIVGKTKRVYMHRYIINAPDGVYIDHINGNKLDNRRENLRVATNAQNVRNIGVRSNNSSGYKGVSWRADKNMWQAKITHNYKQIHLGLFDNKSDAAHAYNKAAIQLQGEFARLNEMEARA